VSNAGKGIVLSPSANSVEGGGPYLDPNLKIEEKNRIEMPVSKELKQQLNGGEFFLMFENNPWLGEGNRRQDGTQHNEKKREKETEKLGEKKTLQEWYVWGEACPQYSGGRKKTLRGAV